MAKAFSRSIAMMSAIMAINARSTAFNVVETQNNLAGVGVYRSRGKSGKTARNKTPAHMANVRSSRTARNVAKRK